VRGLRKFAAVSVALLGIGGVLSGCSSLSNFDPDSLDFFNLNEKKKLPGERRAVFPEGVPGVSQGVPPELIKGRQPQPGAEAAVVEPAAAPAQQQESKPKPRVATRPARISVSPSQPKPAAETQQQQSSAPAQQTQQTGVNSPWPSAPPPQQPSPWPSAPQPGTFQR